LKYEDAGNQYVEKVTCGLPVCSAKFAIMPPQVVDCDKSQKTVQSFFPGMISHIHCFCEYFSASILFHFNKLRSIISPTEPLLVASFLTSSYLDQLPNKFVTIYPWDEGSVEIDIIRGEQEHPQEISLLSYNSESPSQTVSDQSEFRI